MSDVPTTTERNPAVVALVAVGAIIVLGLLWLLVVAPLLGGDDPGDDEAIVPRAQPTGDPAIIQGDDEDEAEIFQALPVETYEIFLSRDPFEPVIPAPAGAGDGTTGDGTTGDGTTGDGTTGDGTTGDGTTGDGTNGDGGTPKAIVIDVFTDDQGTPRALIRVGDLIYTVGEGDTFADGFTVVAIEEPCVTLAVDGQTLTFCEGGTGPDDQDGTDGTGGTDGTDGCRGQEEVVCNGHVVTLVDVFTDEQGRPRAVVRVDSTMYEVRTGDVFADNFQVLSVDPPCVTLLFGDDAFTLCEGERALK